MATQQEQPAAGPLAGLRVIEMGQLLAGPFAGSRLADFGADVIKVEAPGSGDPMRAWGHHRYEDKTLWWPVLARNKRVVTANLRVDGGREIVRKLIAEADALIENFKPGTLEKWGLGPEELHRINPSLIIVRVSGYGQTGPYADRPGFASVGEAMGGIRYINGFPDRPPPRFGISLGDTLTALFAVEGLLMALHWREHNGGAGQVIDASIVESCFSMLESALPEYDKCGVVRTPSGTGLANVAPSNIYPTRDGTYMVIAANLEPMFRRLCAAMEAPHLAEDERFRNHTARGEHVEELDGLIAEWTVQHDKDELFEKLDKHGVVCGPIYSIADIANDKHFQARGAVSAVPDPRFGELKVPGIFPLMSETPGKVRWLGPAEPGQHNAEVLSELGYSEDDIATMKSDGII